MQRIYRRRLRQKNTLNLSIISKIRDTNLFFSIVKVFIFLFFSSFYSQEIQQVSPNSNPNITISGGATIISKDNSFNDQVLQNKTLAGNKKVKIITDGNVLKIVSTESNEKIKNYKSTSLLAKNKTKEKKAKSNLVKSPSKNFCVIYNANSKNSSSFNIANDINLLAVTNNLNYSAKFITHKENYTKTYNNYYSIKILFISKEGILNKGINNIFSVRPPPTFI